MKILTLDLGTKTGWAYRNSGRSLQAGTWRLMSPKEVTAQGKLRGDRRLDQRIPRLYEKLSETRDRVGGLDWIVFEDVQFGSTTMQAHLWASFRTVIWLFASLSGIKTECLATGKLKVFAAGHGAATKDMMAAWLCKKCPNDFRHFDGATRRVDNNEVLDDNAVDAIHLLLWAEQTLKNP